MTTLSDLLSEALSTPVRRRPDLGDGNYVVPTSMHEAVDPWMTEFMRQVQIVAPKYEAFLKKSTGRGFKLFRTFVTDNGRIRVRFDPSKRAKYEFGPMVVLRAAYSRAADLYNVEVEVYGTDVSQKLASHEVTDVDIELLADPQRMLFGVRDALVQLGSRRGSDASPNVVSRAKERVADKTEGLAGELGAILGEARLGSSAEGGSLDGERSNPTKTGPAAERSRVLKTAVSGIERMLQAIEVVRGMVKSLGLGAKDKTGAAAAALKIAMSEISKVEDVQSLVTQIFDLPGLDAGAIERVVTEATADVLSEKRSAPSMDVVRAKEGLAKLVDGLRQLHGMLRQAKLTGRVLDQVEAAINGLKSTRDAIDELNECSGAVMAMSKGDDQGIPYGRFEPTLVADIGEGWWVVGGGDNTIYRKVAHVQRGDRYTFMRFTEPYVGADGEQHLGARFPNGMKLRAAKG